MRYAERTKMRYNAVDRIFYDAIKDSVFYDSYAPNQIPKSLSAANAPHIKAVALIEAGRIFLLKRKALTKRSQLATLSS